MPVNGMEMGIRMKDIIISGKDVCKSYVSNGKQNHVLDMINIDIYQGEFAVIMGLSGAGKSTLLYSLSGMDKITNGSVYYKGNEISRYKEKKMSDFRANEFGFIFQQAHLVSNLTLYENVTVTGFQNKKRTSKETKKRAHELLSKVNISDAGDRLPSQVSGGEAQRAAIARAMINDPGIIFADEPTGALNRKNTHDVLNLLTQLNEEGQSILMVTHDIHAAIRATRILYLEDGKIIGEMSLSPYKEEDFKQREEQVNAWLTSMEW